MKKTKYNKLIEKHKSNYILNPGIGKYKDKLEVSKWNPKGFYNVIGHINNESELDNFILEDLNKTE